MRPSMPQLSRRARDSWLRWERRWWRGWPSRGPCQLAPGTREPGAGCCRWRSLWLLRRVPRLCRDPDSRLIECRQCDALLTLRRACWYSAFRRSLPTSRSRSRAPRSAGTTAWAYASRHSRYFKYFLRHAGCQSDGSPPDGNARATSTCHARFTDANPRRVAQSDLPLLAPFASAGSPDRSLPSRLYRAPRPRRASRRQAWRFP